jgi:hypothetical protein
MNRSAVMLCIVGNKWINPAWHRIATWRWFGKQKFDSVEMEIEIAFKLGVPILPILVDDAEMPNEVLLPKSIDEFASLNAAQVHSGRSFEADIRAVLEKVEAFRKEGALFKDTPTFSS